MRRAFPAGVTVALAVASGPPYLFARTNLSQ
jgi:hypothetical protein